MKNIAADTGIRKEKNSTREKYNKVDGIKIKKYKNKKYS